MTIPKAARAQSWTESSSKGRRANSWSSWDHGIMVKYWISMGYFFEISMVFKWWYQVWMGQRNLINHQAWMVETCWNPNKIMGCLLPINWWFGFRNHPQYHGDIMVYLGWWGKVPPLPQVKQPWASDIDYNQYGASTFDFNVFSI